MARASIIVHCPSPWMRSAAESLYQSVKLDSPVTLVLDHPLGYALQVLPLLRPPFVVSTQGGSPYYLQDLSAYKPSAVLLEPVTPERMLEVLKMAAAGAVLPTEQVSELDALTPRERQVARLLLKGLSDKEIASILEVETKTVSHWVYNLRQKLGADNRSQVGLLYLGITFDL